MHFRVTAATHRGRRRASNEDGFLVDSFALTSALLGGREGLSSLDEVSAPALLAVADGMGGEFGGDVASSVALRRLFYAHREMIARAPIMTPTSAMLAAHRAVNDARGSDPRLRHMGTTASAVFISDLSPDGASATIAHVGDSRVYLVRNGAAQQLTEDHSVVADLVRSGHLRLSEDDQRTHPRANQIIRSLGQDERLDVDARTIPIQVGDKIILCSDGLWGELPAAHLRREMVVPGATAPGLLQLALAAGGTDNVTVVVAEVLG